MGGSADLIGLSDFTPLERSAAFTFNLIPLVSIGSWMMADYKGGFIGTSIQMVGFTVCILASIFGYPSPDKADFTDPDGTFHQDKYDAADEAAEYTALGLTGIITGLFAMAGGYVFNLVRPYHVHKAQPKNAQLSSLLSIDNLSVSYIPGVNDDKIMIAYKMAF
jgi:hypothetical protein